MKSRDFLKTLDERQVLLFDGAMGTMLYSHGIYINRCYDELNLSRPDLVRTIHAEYVKAGAECVETNTYGANRHKLGAHGFAEKLAEINRQGALIAREAAGDGVFVAGAIGPLGNPIEPYGRITRAQAYDAFLEQAHALAEGDVDLFILETFTNLEEIFAALAALKEHFTLPVIAQVTLGPDGNSPYGTPPEQFAKMLDDKGADVIGLNCSVGPPRMLEAIEKMVGATRKPVSAQPNAGTPVTIEGRNFYLASGEYMAEYARRFIAAGARVVGGCCGTTPEYIKLMSKSVRSAVPRKRELVIEAGMNRAAHVDAVPVAEKSRLAKKLAGGGFVTSVEIVPPHGCDATKIIEASRVLKKKGVDAVNIPDGPRALARMGAQHTSLLIEQATGIETVLHYTCRDRNLLGMMSDFMGLYPLGLRNVLIITGDPPKMGDYPDATAVFDVDSIGLVRLVHNLNLGYDIGGNPIGKPTGYFIGVGVNPGAIDPELEIARFHAKIEAGAEFAITQPVFDTGILFRFLDRIRDVTIPIIAGIWPLVSLRNAEFMNTEVPGASVPERIMERMRAASSESKEAALAEGIAIARESAAEIMPRVRGIQVSAPFGNVKYTLDVLESVMNG